MARNQKATYPIDIASKIENELPKGKPILYFPSIQSSLPFEFNGLKSQVARQNNSYNVSVEKIPDLQTIIRRSNNFKEIEKFPQTLFSPDFLKMLVSVKKVKIIDSSLSLNEIEALLDLLFEIKSASNSNNIDITFLSHSFSFQNHTTPLRRIKERFKNKGIIRFYKLKKKLFHDRFVLFDAELWHYGGKIGGLMQNISAYSYGWGSCGFIELFEELLDPASRYICEEIKC